MATMDTTLAVYHDKSEADADWSALEEAASASHLKIADAALVENEAGETVILQRQSRHGWGKGVVVGAVVGVLFPPSIIGSALVGAAGGGLIARMSRALGRGNVKDLGEALDSGTFSIIVVSPSESTNAICQTLTHAVATTTVESSTEEDVHEQVDSWTLRSGAGPDKQAQEDAHPL